MHQRKWVHLLHQSLLGALFSFFCLSPANAEAQGKERPNEVVVIGTGPLVNENVAKARKKAISEALAKGVEKYLIQLLGKEGMINNFPRLIQNFLPRAKEGIENFHILAEEQLEGSYKILVRLKVNDKVLEERLREIGIVLMEGPPIKVLFLVSQIEPKEGKVTYWWKDPESESDFTLTDLVLHRVFQERGFNPVNRMSRVPEEDYSLEMKILELSDEDAIKWGALYGANVVILGQCEIVKGKAVSVILKALDVENGVTMSQNVETILMDNVSDSMEAITQATEKAIKNITTRLGPEIIKAFSLNGPELHQFKVTLQGLKGFGQFRVLQDFLKKEIEGVKSVIQTRVKGYSISMSVEFMGAKDKFLKAILKHENLPFPADVVHTDEGEIIMTIR